MLFYEAQREKKAERLKKTVTCKEFLKTAIGWVITCIVVGLTTGLLVSQGVYGPSLGVSQCPTTNSTV